MQTRLHTSEVHSLFPRADLLTCRSALAEAYEEESYAHLCQQHLAAGHPLAVVTLLERCALAAQPAAEAQLAAMLTVLEQAERGEAGGGQGGDVGVGERTAGKQPGGVMAAEAGQSEGFAEEGGMGRNHTGQHGQRWHLEPWDVAYAQQLLIKQACAADGTDFGSVQQYMTLRGILQVSLAVQLEILCCCWT